MFKRSSRSQIRINKYKAPDRIDDGFGKGKINIEMAQIEKIKPHNAIDQNTDRYSLCDFDIQ